MKIQSISDLITNSSTEVFLTYNSRTADDIRNLVTSILSLVDPSKTFDDYFTIEMDINYDDLEWILDDLVDDLDRYVDEFPWLEEYAKCDNSQEFMESLNYSTIESVFDFYDNGYYDCPRYMFCGYTITPKVDDPVVDKVKTVLHSIPDFFGVDYYSSL